MLAAQLPVEQYRALDAQLVTPLGGNFFNLNVPKLKVGLLSSPYRVRCMSSTPGI